MTDFSSNHIIIQAERESNSSRGHFGLRMVLQFTQKFCVFIKPRSVNIYVDKNRVRILTHAMDQPPNMKYPVLNGCNLAW